jgi:hypothetical protein
VENLRTSERERESEGKQRKHENFTETVMESRGNIKRKFGDREGKQRKT